MPETKKLGRGRKAGSVVRGSVVYQLAALHHVPRILILADDVTRMMKTITAHFLRSPELHGLMVRQRAVYGVVPSDPAVVHAVLVERL